MENEIRDKGIVVEKVVEVVVPIDSLKINCDYETSERCGAGGMFQVCSVTAITDEGEFNITEHVDQGTHFETLEEVADSMGLGGIHVEEV